MIKAILGMFNGHKFNTGVVMIIAVSLLKQLGMDNDAATQVATNVMLGVGAIITLWGYIHKFIKVQAEKK